MKTRNFVALLLVLLVIPVCVGASVNDTIDPNGNPTPVDPTLNNPWWVSLITTVVTALIGVLTRWFEKNFLKEKVTKQLTETIRSKDPSVKEDAIARAVADAFAGKHKSNGTHL